MGTMHNAPATPEVLDVFMGMRGPPIGHLSYSESRVPGKRAPKQTIFSAYRQVLASQGLQRLQCVQVKRGVS